jgi:hypothetical protein
MIKKTSPHILNTSANLLGFCLFVITSLQVSSKAEESIIDEFTSVIAVLLIFSCLLSFVSIRTSNHQKEQRLETAADYLFVASLVGVLLIILLIAFNFIK